MRLDYFEIVDPETLDPVDDLSRSALVAVAAFVGKARLIDNIVLPGRPRRGGCPRARPAGRSSQFSFARDPGELRSPAQTGTSGLRRGHPFETNLFPAMM